jgi:hypothetical protein
LEVAPLSKGFDTIKQEPVSGPNIHALLAQLVAAQVRAEAAMAALAHAQMESRAEAARTSARLAQIEEGLRALLETPTGGCGEGEETRAG